MDLKIYVSHTTITNQKMIVALLLLILKIVFALPKLSPHSYYLETCADQMVDLCNSNL